MRQIHESQGLAHTALTFVFSVSVATAVLLGSAFLVICAPGSQRLWLTLSPTPEVSLNERLTATKNILNFFAAGNRVRLHGYSPDETAHLEEVAGVARTAAGILVAALVTTGVTGGLLIRRGGWPATVAHLRRALKSIAVSGAVLLVVSRVAFAPLFVWFHRFTFVAAPWAFDPAVSRLVTLYPEEYFQAMFSATLLTAAAVSWTLFLLLRRK